QHASTGPLTQRTPVASASAKPPSRRAPPSVNDKAVLEGILETLRREDPSKAEESFIALKRIWLAGGREATIDWMTKHTFPSVVDAFNDWMEKNLETAQAMLH